MKHSYIKNCYKEINSYLNGQKRNKFRNFCYFITSDNNEHLNISGEFVSDKIYGISPEFSTREYLALLNSGLFEDLDFFYIGE